MLYEYLKKRGRKAVYLREPGGTRISEKIRKLLLDPANRISAECEMLLYMAARSQVVDQLIAPALKQGRIVICDRFLDSTLAYQGYGLGVDIRLIRSIGAYATRGIAPDLTIFLDLPVGRGLEHRKHCLDRIEQRSLEYHTRVRNGYLKLARQEPKRIMVVRVLSDKLDTQKNIRQLVEQHVF
jgi:dTMP kinase